MPCSPCSICGKGFASEALLRDHSNVAHSSCEDLGCPTCHKIFPNQWTMERHLNAHFKSGHSCNICGEFYSTPLKLFIHVTTFHKYGVSMVCDICDSAYTRKQTLMEHYRSKHARDIPSLERKAEMHCTVHSSRSFQDDLLFDPLASHYISEKSSEEGKLGDATVKDTHPDELKFRDYVSVEILKAPEESRIDQSPQLDLPRLAESPIAEHSTTDRDDFEPDEPEQEVLPKSFPSYLHTLPLDSLLFDGKQYTCLECGMTFEDEVSYVISHMSYDMATTF